MGSTSPAAAAAAVASVRRPADRRALYRRSNTISALPLDSFQSSPECRRPLAPIADSPVQEEVAEATDEPSKPPATADRPAVPRPGRTADARAGRRAQFCRKASCNDMLLSGPSASSGLVTSGGGGRLLSKVPVPSLPSGFSYSSHSVQTFNYYLYCQSHNPLRAYLYLLLLQQHLIRSDDQNRLVLPLNHSSLTHASSANLHRYPCHLFKLLTASDPT